MLDTYFSIFDIIHNVILDLVFIIHLNQSVNSGPVRGFQRQRIILDVVMKPVSAKLCSALDCKEKTKDIPTMNVRRYLFNTFPFKVLLVYNSTCE